MVLRLGLEMLELNRGLPFALAEPWFLAIALVGSHLARVAAGSRTGARGRGPRAW